jgi:23S rRNA pseudouridine1911/1915/1917 synthase
MTEQAAQVNCDSTIERRFSFVVAADAAGMRLDRYLAEQMEASSAHLSRTRLKSLIEEGCVAVGGEVVTSASQRLAADESVVLIVPPAQPAEPKAENIAIDVVYEDSHLLVVDKPAGLVVHPASGHETGTLVNALIAHCGASLSGIGGVKKPGIVHRLDKDTSGLLVVAKTDTAHKGLARLFEDHGRKLHLVREYQAFVWGVPDRAHGVVEAPVGRHVTQREKMAVTKPERGRDAITHWEVVANFGVATLVACRLETGRTHQIRVHMAHIGHPLIGDKTYGAGFKTKAALLSGEARMAVKTLDRQALHAATLGFEHPVTREALLFQSRLPADLAALRAVLEISSGESRNRDQRV